MNRLIALTILASTVAQASAQDALPPPKPDPLGRVLPMDEATAAGIPAGVKPVPLRWDLAYRLAWAKSAEKRADTVLAKVEPLSAEEFGRLRAALVAGGSATASFRDPTPDVLDLLRRSSRVEISRTRTASVEMGHRLFSEYVQGGASSGVTPGDVDRIAETLLIARKEMLADAADYRDALDDLKLRLGLPPDAPIVADRSALDGFARVFNDVYRWAAKEDGNYAELTPLLERLPKRPDLDFDGRSLQDAVSRDGDEGAAFIRSATKTLKDPVAAVRTRKRLRQLTVIASSYELERVRLLILIKAKDTVTQKLIAPPPDRGEVDNFAAKHAAGQATMPRDLFKATEDQLACQTRIVSLWLEGQAIRHALTRDLGILPKSRDELVGGLSATVPIPVRKGR